MNKPIDQSEFQTPEVTNESIEPVKSYLNRVRNLSIIKSAFLCLIALMVSNIALADEPLDSPEVIVENYIPGMWENLYIEADLLESHFGENVKKVCYEDEFDSNPDDFKQIAIRSTASRRARAIGSWESSGSRIKISRYRLMDGGRDFVVAGENTLVISTPMSGTHIVTMKKGCRKELNYAQHLVFSNNKPSVRRQSCLSSSGRVMLTIRNLLTEDGSVSSSKASMREMYVCSIDEIFKWNGDLNIAGLVSASVARRAENYNNDDKTEE